MLILLDSLLQERKKYCFQPCLKRSQQRGALLTTGIKLKKTKLPPSRMYPQANQGEDPKILTANPMSHLENQGEDPKILTANPMSHLENQEEDQRLLNKLAIRQKN